MGHQTILIIDFGGSSSQLVARKIRNSSVYCEIIPYRISLDKIKEIKPVGIILTGGIGSEEAKTSAAEEIFKLGTPVIGFAKEEQKVGGVQFYLECANAPADDTVLESFLTDTCACVKDWRMDNFIKASIENIKNTVGEGRALCALSGGVDSAVSAVMMHRAIGDKLTCIFVDHGLMRKDEGDEVEDVFGRQYNMNFIRINAQDRFLNKLEGVSDPEKKRKIIGEEFIRVFEEEAKKIGAVDYLVQGTIYPDIVESGLGASEVIKSHHNVGGLPDVIDFKAIIEPLKELFKDEVREAGLEMGMPKNLVFRQPFPGPGLAVRVIGKITKEKLDILREADFIFRDEIGKAGLSGDIWQYFAIITGLKSVGVTARDTRTYGHTIALRAITSIDAMTADWARIPFEVLTKVSERITKDVKEVTRVVYDLTPKPPATIEWE